MMDMTIILASLDKSKSLLTPCNARELRAVKTDSNAEDCVGLGEKWWQKILNDHLRRRRDH